MLTDAQTASRPRRLADPRVRDAFDALLVQLERTGYLGWDPYDALTSPLLSGIARTRLLRRACLQTVKRSPLNLRPLLRVPRGEHAKALALAISAHARLDEVEPERGWLERAEPLVQRLAAAALGAGGGVGWGYAFDVETRWGSYRAGEPNAVVTAYALHALLDAGAAGRADLPQSVRGATAFASGALAVDRDGETFFGYYRGSEVPIHNANVLVATAVGRATELASSERERARRAIGYTVRRQRRDGSWPYGETPQLGWVDGFHSAYVLERLAQWQRLEPSAGVVGALVPGTRFFVERLVDRDGAARASTRSRHPVETHAAASAVTALAGLQEYDERARETAQRVLHWALARLRRGDGRFAFRRERLGLNRVPYVRWSDAHMLLALANQLGVEGS